MRANVPLGSGEMTKYSGVEGDVREGVVLVKIWHLSTQSAFLKHLQVIYIHRGSSPGLTAAPLAVPLQTCPPPGVRGNFWLHKLFRHVITKYDFLDSLVLTEPKTGNAGGMAHLFYFSK